jgi:hypothetical protein
MIVDEIIAITTKNQTVSKDSDLGIIFDSSRVCIELSTSIDI